MVIIPIINQIRIIKHIISFKKILINNTILIFKHPLYYQYLLIMVMFII